MRIGLTVTGQDPLALKAQPERWRSSLREEMWRQCIELQTHVVRDKLNGQVLHNRTGTLARSINIDVKDDERGVTGWFGSFAGYVSPSGAFAAAYAKIHEYGAVVKVPAHTRAVAGKVQNVREYTATFPERSFLRSALRDYRNRIKAGFREAMVKALKA